MSDAAGASHLDVYGVDHSPWVQAVLLGLVEKKLPHTLTPLPPFSVFRESGVLMPAASVDGEPWRLESGGILQRVGYEALSTEEMRAILAAWNGVAHRADSARRFFHAFSLIRDPDPSPLRRLRNHFLRSFATLYFYLLIRFVVLSGKRSDPESFADQFLPWERRLEESRALYLAGEAPGTLDMMLFGIVQCHCSIPVPPIEALQGDPKLPRLRSWISAMQERFAGYPHLYSGVYFEPHAPAPPPAPPLERAAFWLGSAFMLISFPITVPLIVFFATQIRRTGQVP